eukprot:jgi/Tetstr1/438628/TSEL_027179.t1
MHRFLLLAAVLLILGEPADCRSNYRVRVPNGFCVPNPDGSGACRAFGHTGCNLEGGGNRNPFGTAFEAAGLRWTVELCRADSDGDGLTNGEELGDPECTWTEGSEALSQSALISHPGFASSAAEDAVTCAEVTAVARAPPPAEPTNCAPWLRLRGAALMATGLLLLLY